MEEIALRGNICGADVPSATSACERNMLCKKFACVIKFESD